MKKILLAAEGILERHVKLFEDACEGKCEFIVKRASEVTKDDLKGVNAIVGNVPAEVVAGAYDIELMQLNSAGADAYVKEGILPKDAFLCNAVGAYGLTVSEHMLALTFDLIRHLALYRDKQEAHDFTDCGKIISIEGSTIAVLGLGDIGGSYARKVKALGAKHVIGVRRNVNAKVEGVDEIVSFDDVNKAFAKADIVAMVLPDSPNTRNLINKDTLAIMKKGAYIINVGRGTSVNQEDLLDAVRSGHIAGAALDVTNPEPLPKESPLYDEPNIFITPHVAGNFFLQETFERMIAIAVKNVKAYILGKDLINIVKH